VKWVIFVGGGYDVEQDNDIPPADDKGRAVYVIDVLDGSLVKRFSNAEIPEMTYSIPSDVMRVDVNRDEKIDRLYVGDMGGRIWRFDIGNSNPAAWEGRIIFAGYSGTKLFYPPDVTLERGYQMLFFGTGDREHPKEPTVVNRLYAVKDQNLPGILTEANLYDVTSDEYQAAGTTEERKAEIIAALASSSGWFIRLENQGEKCLSAATVLSGVAYFTTFAPGAGDAGDPCLVGEGAARIYALEYKTGNAAYNLDLTNDGIRKSDRSINIGKGIPSGVVIIYVKGEGIGFIGVGGGVSGFDPKSQEREETYWKIIF
jgi:type IV pilus assembly protein PilY1